MDLYCVEDAMPICALCSLDRNKYGTKTIQSMDVASARLTDRHREWISSSLGRIRDLNVTVDDLDDSLKGLQAFYTKEEQRAADHFEALREAVDRREEEVHKWLEVSLLHNTSPLLRARRELLRKRQTILDAVTAVSESMASMDERELLVRHAAAERRRSALDERRERKPLIPFGMSDTQQLDNWSVDVPESHPCGVEYHLDALPQLLSAFAACPAPSCCSKATSECSTNGGKNPLEFGTCSMTPPPRSLVPSATERVSGVLRRLKTRFDDSNHNVKMNDTQGAHRTRERSSSAAQYRPRWDGSIFQPSFCGEAWKPIQ